ncbi:MAG: hypothetical protein ACE5IH_10355, partial [Thermodesulfobacteriota bacterium]
LLVEAGQGLEKTDSLKAAKFYEDASAISKDAEDISKLILASAMLYERNGKSDKAHDLFKRYLLSDAIPIENEAEARYRLGRIQFEAGSKAEGVEILTPLMEWKGKIDDQLIAKASLLVLQERQERYLKIKLIPPFEETLQKKTMLLEALLKEYADVARYRILELQPEVFYQMGVILENFRDSIINSERPKDLTQEEIEEYNFLLEEKAYPYDEEAVKAYEKSVQAGWKHHTIFVNRSLERLADLRPALYKREFEKKWMKPIFIYPEVVALEDKDLINPQVTQ